MPTRYLKPGVRDSELIESLSPMAEVLFYRLLVTVDDFGRFDARPAMIKSQCFPIKDKISAKHCEELLKELSEAGLVAVYVHDGKPYLQILKWDNKPRATDSKFPALTGECIQMYTSVCKPHTSVPVTVTVTGTETDKKKQDAAASPPDGVSQSTWQDFLKIRKAKKAPMTDAALQGIEREAKKAGWSLESALQECCLRGWQGFKAEWVAEKMSVQQITTPARAGPDPALAKIIAEQGLVKPMPPEIRAALGRK